MKKIGVPPAVDELIQDSNVDRGILSQPFCEESGKFCPFTLIAPSHLNLKYVKILSFDLDLPDLVVSRGRCRNSSGRHFSSPPASRASHWAGYGRCVYVSKTWTILYLEGGRWLERGRHFYALSASAAVKDEDHMGLHWDSLQVKNLSKNFNQRIPNAGSLYVFSCILEWVLPFICHDLLLWK